MFVSSLKSMCLLVPLSLAAVVAANLACDGSFEFSFNGTDLSGEFTVNDGSDAGDGGDTSGSGGTGMLRVLVTDKPFPFEFLAEANVTITRVEISGSGDDGDDDSDDGDDDESDSEGGDSDHDDESAGGDDGDGGDASNGNDDGDGGDGAGGDPSADGEGDDTTQAKAVAFQVNDSDGDDDDDGSGDDDDGEDGDDDGADENGDSGDSGVDEADSADGEDGDSGGDDDSENEGDEDSDAVDDSGENGDDSGESFTVIFEGEQLFNLLDLRNGRSDLLADAEVPAGTYTRMRVFVTEGEVVLTDGRVFPLSVPSGSQSGIKLNFTFEVVADEETELLLDIDLSRVFNAIPGGHIDDVDGIQEFQFRPSLGMRLINLLETGSAAGTVTDGDIMPLENVAVTAFDGDDEVTSTSTDPDGTYMLTGLLPGTYRVEFETGGFNVVEVEDVVVVAGEPTEGVDAVLTSGDGGGGDGGDGGDAGDGDADADGPDTMGDGSGDE